jgi:hypothetical protein
MGVYHGDSNRDFSHYSPELIRAMNHFREVYLTYMNQPWWRLKENAHRLDSVQTAWDTFARLRKEETGSGFYTERYVDK